MVHLRALPRAKKSDLPIWLAALLMAITGGIYVWLPDHERFTSLFSAMLTGEAIYRLFMAFYGLVFPAYVWVCMVPLGRGALGLRPRAVLAWGGGVVLAVPMFWMGFIEGRMWWLGLAGMLRGRR